MGAAGVDYDGEISKQYEQGRSLSPAAVSTWREAVGDLIPDTGLIADVGAGTGRFARQFDLLAPGRVLAIEPSSGMRGSAQRSHPGQVIWMGGSAERMPLADSSVQLVWTAFTAHYFDLAAAASEFARVLAPGGQVLVWHAFPDIFDGLEWFRWFPTARALADQQGVPSAQLVQRTFEDVGMIFEGRTEHHMRIADDMAVLADRLAHRSISTLSLISDEDFEQGLTNLRAHAAESDGGDPVYAVNVMLRFRA